jgi:lipopolysaccharide/colanic/teichoic acid biosynthesis glycosyltransferase
MKKNRFMLWILATDLLWVTVAFLGANLLRYGVHWDTTQNAFIHDLLPFLLMTWVVWAFLSDSLQLDGFRGGWRSSATVSALFLGVLFLMTVLLAVSYLLRDYVSRLAIAYVGILLLAGFIAIRYGARRFLRARHEAGKVGRVLIVGSGQIAQELASKIDRHPEMLSKVVGFLSPYDSSIDAGLLRNNGSNSETLSTLQVVDLICSEHVDELVLALARPSWPDLLNLVGRCRELGVSVSLVPQPYELYLSKPHLLDLGGLPLLRLQERSDRSLLFRWKRAVDLLEGLMLSLFALPVLVPAAIALRVSKGRAFRWESRTGKDGRIFSMLRLNVDRHSPDLTGLEQFLQHLSITELPQLINVLRGDMSVVGPRPESPSRVRHYSEWQKQRLSVKPGITGLAQVHGLREQNSSEEKTRFDLQYLLGASPLMDLSLLLQTSWTLAGRMFQYPANSSAEQGVLMPKQRADFRFPSVEEALHRAHRSQSSAD